MILCLGTTPVLQRTMVFDRLHVDAVNRAMEVTESASGKSINVARVAHLLGEAVTATGFLGGESGSAIRSELDVSGIAHDFVTVTPKTRMCVTALDRSAGAATELVEESKAVDPAAWEDLRSRVRALLPRAKVMVLSGSLTPGAPQDFYADCVTLANAAGVKTVVDATGGPLRRALAARPLVVKPNRAELAKTLEISIESDAALRDAVKRLIAMGPAWAVITQGREGAIVSDGDRFWRVQSAGIKAVNPIGSGDSLAAGLAVAIARGQAVPDACKLGVACGAANAMTLLPGTVRPEDVAELAAKIDVEVM